MEQKEKRREVSQKYDRVLLFFVCPKCMRRVCFDRFQQKYSSFVERQAGNNIHYFSSPQQAKGDILVQENWIPRNFPKEHGSFGFV